jgi:hypothetical protein
MSSLFVVEIGLVLLLVTALIGALLLALRR